jgi:hypothetical protein
MEDIEKSVQEFRITNIEDAVEFAIKLKRHADKSEELLITFLCRVEDSGIWTGHTGKGPSTFANWLRMHLSFDAVRYANGRKALSSVDKSIRDVVGFEAAKQIAHFDDDENRNKATELCLEWSERNGGGPVPLRTAVDIASAVSPSNNPTVRADEKIRLRAELHAVRIKCQQLEQELAAYRERFGDLETAPPARKQKDGKNKRAEEDAPVVE